jgi:hypothetical protein
MRLGIGILWGRTPLIYAKWVHIPRHTYSAQSAFFCAEGGCDIMRSDPVKRSNHMTVAVLLGIRARNEGRKVQTNRRSIHVLDLLI